jgi:replicative DNA helicase
MKTDLGVPYSAEAEQCVLGALIIDNDAYDRLDDLRAEHFFLRDHATIFGEIVANVAAGKTCDVISLMVALEGQVPDAGAYLNALVQATPSSANIRHYAAIVRDKAIMRALFAFGRDVAERALAPGLSATALVDDAATTLSGLAEARVRRNPVKASVDLGNHLVDLERRLVEGTNSISTGYADLDEKLSGGIRPGELIVLAARPKMGKTGLALNVACNVAQAHNVLLLSMEMPRAQLHDRNIAALGSIPLSHLLRPAMMTQGDWDALSVAAGKIQQLNLYLDDQGGLSLLDVRLKAIGMKRKHGLALLVIDYLQLMEADGDSRNAQIEKITRGLKTLAKELEIGILLLSQLNRDLEKRPDRRPQPSDLRDSGAIEQDADAVIFLYRDEVYNQHTSDKGLCEVNVALCRQGAPGTVALRYVGEQTRFENLSFSWSPNVAVAKKRGLAEYL